MRIRVTIEAIEAYNSLFPRCGLSNREIAQHIKNDVRRADPSGVGKPTYPMNHNGGGEGSFCYIAQPDKLGIIINMLTHQEAKELGYI